MPRAAAELATSQDAWVWLAVAVAGAAVLWFAVHARRAQAPPLGAIAAALSLFFGLAVGVLGTGHTTAVSINASRGAISSGSRVLLLIAYGVSLAVPGYVLGLCAARLIRDHSAWKLLVGLNAWLLAAVAIPAPQLSGFAAVNILLLIWLRRRTTATSGAA